MPAISKFSVLALLLAFSLFLISGCGGDDTESDDATTATTATTDFAGLDIETCGDVEYDGDGEPTALIVSDLPLQGDSAERSEQQNEAIRLALDEADWVAGDVDVAFQACDDSIAKTGAWDEQTCEDNATAYAADERVLGVIGTYNSGCAAIEIPILNEAGVAMISPGNTAVCLTEASSNCEDGQPDSLYPSGDRNYARVVPNDAFQGAALVEFTQGLGSTNPFVLYATDDPTSTGQADNYRGAAEEAGLKLAGFETWDPEAKDYPQLVDQVASEGADAVILAGLTEQNGAELIKEKVQVVGPNDEVPLIAFDGFAQQATIDEAGADSEGMYASIPGSAPENLSAEGVDFVEDLEEELGGTPVEQFAPYAGEAANVLLGAIETGGEDRAAVIAAVFETVGGGGILNPYDIGPNGDPTAGPVTILKAADTFEVDDEVVPDEALVAAARG